MKRGKEISVLAYVYVDRKKTQRRTQTDTEKHRHIDKGKLYFVS